MMGAFRNLNVQVKLLAGFGVLAALAGGIALVGTRDLNASDNDISVLHEQYFSLIAELSDLTADVGTVRTDMMGMVDYDGTESITLGWNGVKKASTEVDNSFERLATTVRPSAGTARHWIARLPSLSSTQAPAPAAPVNMRPIAGA